MSEQPQLKQILEGAILAAERPLSIDALIQLFLEEEQPSRADVKQALEDIQSDCEGRGFELKEVASGFRFQVRRELGEWVGRLWEEKPPRYTRALLETLALIAYKQPITRGDIEEIRGVSVSTNIIRTLLEREWIRIVGHRDVPGRTAIYATTKIFLDYFNLTSLDEMPTLAEIKDLDKMNEELDLETELIEPRSLNLEQEDSEADDSAADDETLDDVTNKVNEIQENIKNLFKEPEEEDFDDDLDDEDNDEVPESDEAGTSDQDQTGDVAEVADEQPEVASGTASAEAGPVAPETEDSDDETQADVPPKPQEY